MADTRVANARYQLEVDEMILEYLLYHAIKSSLEEAAVGQNVPGNGGENDSVKDERRRREETTRLLAIFDGTFPDIYSSGLAVRESNELTHIFRFHEAIQTQPSQIPI